MNTNGVHHLGVISTNGQHPSHVGKKRSKDDRYSTGESQKIPSPLNLHENGTAIQSEEGADKKKFKKLNPLEIKGIRQKIKELATELEERPTTDLELKLKRAVLSDLGSSYQYTREALEKAKTDLEKSQKTASKLQEEMRLKDASLVKVQNSLNASLTRISTLEDEGSTFKKQLSEASKKLSQTEAKLDFETKKHVQEIESIKDKSLRTTQDLEKRVQQEHTRLTETEKKLDDTQTKYANTLIKAHNHEEMCKQVIAAKTKLESNLSLERSKNMRLEEQASSLRQAFDSMKEKFEALKSQNQELTGKKITLESDLSLERSKNEQLEKQTSKLERKIETAKKTHAALQSQNQELTGAKTTLESDLALERSKNGQLEKQTSSLTQALDSMKENFKTLQSQNAEFQKHILEQESCFLAAEEILKKRHLLPK